MNNKLYIYVYECSWHLFGNPNDSHHADISKDRLVQERNEETVKKEITIGSGSAGGCTEVKLTKEETIHLGIKQQCDFTLHIINWCKLYRHKYTSGNVSSSCSPSCSSFTFFFSRSLLWSSPICSFLPELSSLDESSSCTFNPFVLSLLSHFLTCPPNSFQQTYCKSLSPLFGLPPHSSPRYAVIGAGNRQTNSSVFVRLTGSLLASIKL